jgi:chemotaxis protein CheD
MEAKVFGAGKVLDNLIFDVAKSNAEFTQRYLAALRIPVIASDLGNNYGRKILFFCNTGDVYVKKIREYSSNPEALARERRFFEWLKSHLGGAGHEESQGAYS